MSVDLSQFHQVFFEECHEGLDTMESELLNMDVAAVDYEIINEIFRAAHSIKGGSGTFGFSQVADFTHVVETLLDIIRSEQLDMKSEHIELLLKSVDCIRKMINELEATGACDTKLALELKTQFSSILDNICALNATSAISHQSLDQANIGAQSNSAWNIYFKPSVNIFRTGNDPLRMFRELSEMGELEIVANYDDLPSFSSLDSESCFLSWNLTLFAQVERDKIDEVFEWVADESDIVIKAIDNNLTIEDPELPNIPEQREKEQLSNNTQSGITSEPLPDSKPQTASPKTKDTKTESSSIRVDIDKIDSLINMVGELVITQSMLNELGNNFSASSLPKLLEGLEQLSLHTRELQESVMQIRMLPISFAFARFPRLVHDMSKTLGKKVELAMLGEHTEVDKTVMEKISDPLVHLVRNSLDHGLELPDDRLSLGKDETGKITLNAFHQGGSIVIQIIDDGAGLDEDRILKKAIDKGLVKPTETLEPSQIHDLIFEPGFSTADAVTDISGRGVGMDVVRRNIQELNGTVEVESKSGEGCIFTIRLPLTLAILDGQLIKIGSQVYIFPLISIIESIEPKDQMIHKVSDGCDVLKIRNEFIPIIKLWEVFNIGTDQKQVAEGILVIVEGENIKVAVLVDDLLAQQQVVIKSLQENYKAVPGISGATILGDGRVSLILDISGLIKLAGIGRDAYQIIASSNNHEAA